MLIYGHNLHEKLLGIAISRDYIRYATSYCDILSDPNLQIDIDLAINYNKALTGNRQAASTLTDTLILSGASIDYTTLNFYREKILNRPFIFGNDIQRTFDRFTESDSDSAFLNALKDCLNSPCNLFAETSDSIGRIAQAASTKSNANSFSVGPLKDVFINVVDGVDQTIFNKIPKVFADALVDIGTTVEKAVTNTQEVIAGKKNLDELVQLAQSTGSMRSSNKVYRYTPDIKSYSDISSMGASILTKIKDELGGCFRSFEYAYRYNPYTENTSTPIRTQEEQFNGINYNRTPSGVFAGRNEVFDVQTTFTPEELQALSAAE